MDKLVDLSKVYDIANVEELVYTSKYLAKTPLRDIFNGIQLTSDIPVMIYDGQVKKLKEYTPGPRNVDAFKNIKQILQIHLLLNSETYNVQLSANGGLTIVLIRKNVYIPNVLLPDTLQEAASRAIGITIHELQVSKTTIEFDTVLITRPPSNYKRVNRLTYNKMYSENEFVTISLKPLTSERSRVRISGTSLVNVARRLEECLNDSVHNDSLVSKDYVAKAKPSSCQHYFFRHDGDSRPRKNNVITIGREKYYCDPPDNKQGYTYAGYNIEGEPCCFKTDNRLNDYYRFFSRETTIQPSNLTVQGYNIVRVPGKKGLYYITASNDLDVLPEFMEGDLNSKVELASPKLAFMQPIAFSAILDNIPVNWPKGVPLVFNPTTRLPVDKRESEEFYTQEYTVRNKISGIVDKQKILDDTIRGKLPDYIKDFIASNNDARDARDLVRMGVSNAKYLIDAVAKAYGVIPATLRKDLVPKARELFHRLDNGKVYEKYKNVEAYIETLLDEYYNIPHADVVELLSEVVGARIVILEYNKKMHSVRVPCYSTPAVSAPRVILVLSMDGICDLMIVDRERNNPTLVHDSSSLSGFLDRLGNECTKKSPRVPGCAFKEITVDQVAEKVKLKAQVENGYKRITHVVSESELVIPVQETAYPIKDLEILDTIPVTRNVLDLANGYREELGGLITVIGVTRNDNGEIDNVLTDTGVHVPVIPIITLLEFPLLEYNVYYNVDRPKVAESGGSRWYNSQLELEKSVRDTRLELYKLLNDDKKAAINKIVLDPGTSRTTKVEAIKRVFRVTTSSDVIDYIVLEMTNDTLFKFTSGAFLTDAPEMILGSDSELVAL